MRYGVQMDTILAVFGGVGDNTVHGVLWWCEHVCMYGICVRHVGDETWD